MKYNYPPLEPSAHITWVGRSRPDMPSILCWPLGGGGNGDRIVGPPPRVHAAIRGLIILNWRTGRDGQQWYCRDCQMSAPFIYWMPDGKQAFCSPCRQRRLRRWWL